MSADPGRKTCEFYKSFIVRELMTWSEQTTIWAIRELWSFDCPKRVSGTASLEIGNMLILSGLQVFEVRLGLTLP